MACRLQQFEVNLVGKSDFFFFLSIHLLKMWSLNMDLLFLFQYIPLDGTLGWGESKQC